MNFCSNCGKENTAEARFCSSCGNSMSDTSGLQTNVNNGSSLFAILGWVFTGISILFFPILFAAGGAIFGYLHRKVNQTHGTIIIIAAVACGIFGTLLGMAAAGY